MGSLSQSSHYQPDIQGLRALAVFLVIVYHSSIPGLPGGYVGVDVFFVISGYLITSLLLRELRRDRTISLTRFYARRFRRLLPAATLVLLTTVVTAWFAYSPLALKQFSSSAFATAVYLSNVWFAHLSTDYLAEDTGANPLLHTWSLGVEEQFYLVWPLLLLLIFRFGSPRTLHSRLMWLFGLLLIISLVLAIWLTEHNQPWAFFGSPTRAWEFAAGGLVALWFSQGRMLTKRGALFAGWLGVTLIITAALAFDRSTPFPGLAAIMPVLGATGLISAAHTKKLHGISAMLAIRPMQLIGDMSYSLYLWHWPVFVFFARPHVDLDLWHSAMLIAVVFLLSWLTLLLVENPIRFNKRLSSKVVQSLAFGVALTGTSAAVAFGVRGIAAIKLDDPIQRTFAAAKDDIPRIYSEGCHLNTFGIQPGECVYGNSEGQFVAVLFGDSHAAHWFPALEKIAIKNGWKLISMTKSACPSAMYEPFNKMLGRGYTECTLWQQNAIERIESIRPNLVVLANSRRHVPDNPDGSLEWKTSMQNMLRTLVPVSKRVAIMKDVPWLDRGAPDCLSHAAWRNENLRTNCQITLRSPEEDYVFVAEKEAASGFSNVGVVNMNQSICPDLPCSVYADGLVKYTDAHHLSRSFSEFLAPQLEVALRAIDFSRF